jgi:alpha-glucan,water dikinase
MTNKFSLQSPEIVGYPSNKVGLFIKQSIIFRSDSNSEDLEGYTYCAGIYDSVPMDQEEKRFIDYSADKVIVDWHFQYSIL